MSLKDAIREAVDERDKQEGIREKTPVAESQPDNAVPAAPMIPTGKHGAVKQQSSKNGINASSKAVNTASSNTEEPVQDQEETEVGEKVEFAALTIRVSRQSRIHWLVSAKQQNTTLTAAITEALNARFGKAGE